MAKIQNKSYYTTRLEKQIVENKEKLVRINVIIHYNAEIPCTHKMLR